MTRRLEDVLSEMLGEVVDPYRQFYERASAPGDPENPHAHRAPNRDADGNVIYQREV